MIHIKTLRYEGVKLFVVSVDESFDKPVRCSKGFFLREGPNSQKLTRNEILALAAGAGKFKFDMQICRGFDYPVEFDNAKWQHFLNGAVITPPENRKDLLMNLGFAEEGAGILVEVYDDSVEITNPGRLLFDSSKFGKLSVARNPILFDAFHRLGITEKIGSGINRMRQAMAARNIEVEFDTGDFFIVTLARPESTRKEVTDQVTDQVKKLLRALTTREKSGKELIEELKLKHKPTFRMNYLKPAIEAGLIELTIPEKPKSRFQKYRLTKKGTRYCGKIVDNRE
ncbi:MAG: hypothetical protein JRJ25_03185 [Deltaproteobacteria bacterium]|nr:hypothetical protein [Deltaproteobacteria bacterium]